MWKIIFFFKWLHVFSDFLKGKGGVCVSWAISLLLHLEHGINLNKSAAKWTGPNCKEKKYRELQIIYIYDCCLL